MKKALDLSKQNSRLCKISKVCLDWNFRLNRDFITEQNLQLKLALSTGLKVKPDFSESCVWGSQV